MTEVRPAPALAAGRDGHGASMVGRGMPVSSRGAAAALCPSATRGSWQCTLEGRAQRGSIAVGSVPSCHRARVWHHLTGVTVHWE